MTITINNKTLELVEVPEGAHSFELHQATMNPKSCLLIDFWVSDARTDFSRTGEVYLPTGSYRILCKASEATGEIAREIVDSINPDGYKVCYRDYEGSPDEWLDRSDWFDTATESLSSLIRSLGMDVEKTLILEKIKS